MTDTYDTLELSVADGIAHLTLDDPEHGNAVTAQFIHEFPLAVDRLTSDPSVRAVLLDARGKYFSVGGDVSMFAATDDLPGAVRTGTFGLHTAILRLSRLDAPVVAAVQGAAMGGAVGLLTSVADLIVAGRSASFGAAYAKLGFTLDMGASYGLASRLGPARARRFLLLAEVVDAATAERIGLVDELVDDDALAGTALAQAQLLAAGPTRAYGEVRRLMQTVLGTPFETQLERESEAFARAAGTTDAREGITAFVEKRRASFEGR